MLFVEASGNQGVETSINCSEFVIETTNVAIVSLF